MVSRHHVLKKYGATLVQLYVLAMVTLIGTRAAFTQEPARVRLVNPVKVTVEGWRWTPSPFFPTTSRSSSWVENLVARGKTIGRPRTPRRPGPSST